MRVSLRIQADTVKPCDIAQTRDWRDDSAPASREAQATSPTQTAALNALWLGTLSAGFETTNMPVNCLPPERRDLARRRKLDAIKVKIAV